MGLLIRLLYMDNHPRIAAKIRKTDPCAHPAPARMVKPMDITSVSRVEPLQRNMYKQMKPSWCFGHKRAGIVAPCGFHGREERIGIFHIIVAIYTCKKRELTIFRP